VIERQFRTIGKTLESCDLEALKTHGGVDPSLGPEQTKAASG